MRRASVEMQDALHLDAWSRSSSRSLHVKIYRLWEPQPWIYRFLSIPRRGRDPNHPRWQTMLGYKYRVTLGMMEKFATFELLSLSWSVDGICRLILGLILEVEILRGKLNTGLESDFFLFFFSFSFFFFMFSVCNPYGYDRPGTSRLNAWKQISAVLWKRWGYWREVLVNRSFGHFSLTYRWL